MYMAFMTLLALGLAVLGAILAWAGGTWWFLVAGLTAAWLLWSIALYASSPGQPKRFGEV